MSPEIERSPLTRVPQTFDDVLRPWRNSSEHLSETAAQLNADLSRALDKMEYEEGGLIAGRDDAQGRLTAASATLEIAEHGGVELPDLALMVRLGKLFLKRPLSGFEEPRL